MRRRWNVLSLLRAAGIDAGRRYGDVKGGDQRPASPSVVGTESGFRRVKSACGMIQQEIRDEGGEMAPIVESIEISRRPEEVFSYVTDPTHLPDWQESVVSVRRVGDGPVGVGSRVVVTRRVGGRDREMTSELAELNPPRSWAVRGVDGPIRGNVKGRIEPLENGERSRLTIELDFEANGIGKLLLPLVVRRQAQAEVPKNQRKLKELLESGA
jgi:uncharacterized protein YndB with AHSA1/START domain